MSFPDSLTGTFDGSAVTLNRTSVLGFSATYQSADGLATVVVSHDKKKRTRHHFKVTVTKSVSDPLVPANSAPVSVSSYTVVDVPLFGYSTADQIKIAAGQMSMLTASSNALLTKLIGNES